MKSSVTKILVSVKFEANIWLSNKQEGPEGPGSLTCGKGQRSQWSHLQRTTNIVHQILVEDL